MAYTDIDDPSDYFIPKLYTGTGSSNAITGVGFQPDWVWIKSRSDALSHATFDSVRGVTKVLVMNATTAEYTNTDTLTAFGTDGFTVGSNTGVNTNTATRVAWNWKAGTSFTNDASSTSIGTIDSTGSVNTDAGFAIISYTGTGSAETIAHGLGTTPALIISRKRSDSGSWFFWNKSFSATQYLSMDTTNAVGAASSVFGTLPTSTVYSTGGGNGTGASSDTFISYLFAEKKGYSKFGSYKGTNNANGTFVYTGFSVGWVMIKNTDTSGTAWVIQDSKRSSSGGGNQADKRLRANASNAEETDSPVDLLSSGFKIRSTGSFTSDANNFIYMAFAENPFVTSSGISTTGR